MITSFEAQASLLEAFFLSGCYFSYGVSGIHSTYDSDTKDRVWSYQCAHMTSKKDHVCEWTRKYARTQVAQNHERQRR